MTEKPGLWKIEGKNERKSRRSVGGDDGGGGEK